MPIRRHHDNDDDWEAPEDDDWSESDDEPTVECPHCGREVVDDVAQCPYCKQYLSQEDAPAKYKPWWIVLAVLFTIYVIIRGAFGFW